MVHTVATGANPTVPSVRPPTTWNTYALREAMTAPSAITHVPSLVRGVSVRIT